MISTLSSVNAHHLTDTWWHSQPHGELPVTPLDTAHWKLKILLVNYTIIKLGKYKQVESRFLNISKEIRCPESRGWKDPLSTPQDEHKRDHVVWGEGRWQASISYLKKGNTHEKPPNNKAVSSDFSAIFIFGHIAQLVGSYFPDQGLNSCPQQWQQGVLTTTPPGNSHLQFFERSYFQSKLRI